MQYAYRPEQRAYHGGKVRSRRTRAGLVWCAAAATQGASASMHCLSACLPPPSNHPEELHDDEDEDGVPTSCKALFPILTTSAGPDLDPANPQLKMLLTSAGLMPTSAPELRARYETLRSATPGKGVLYLMDAKLKTLGWQSFPSDPAKDNHNKYVTYQRDPEACGGQPKLDTLGAPIPKGQDSLAVYGYHSVEYALRTNHHYSNGHLDVIASGQPGEAVPVYLSYLSYDGDVLDAEGRPHLAILLARGEYKDGVFTLFRAGTSEPFTPADYEASPTYTGDGNLAFGMVSDEAFSSVVSSVQTVWSCGGVTWMTVLHLQPKLMNNGKALEHVNPYGKTVLDAVKAGEVVYVGQSAGSVAMSFNIGPLTTDPHTVRLEMSDDDLQTIDYSIELGRKMMQPGLGRYVGIPYRLLFRPHLSFLASNCAYAGRALATERLADVLTDGLGIDATHNIYCAVTADYNFKAGQGDVVEIADGSVTYHVGFCDEKLKLHTAARQALELMHPEWLKAEGGSPYKQPPGNDSQGRAFQWSPGDGEVHAAGPRAQRPFHLFASSKGPSPSAPLY